MADLLWNEVRNFFDPNLMGALPDVSVTSTSAEDWQAVFDMVRSEGWAWEYFEGDIAGRLPSAAEILSRPADAELAQLRVWPTPAVLVIFRLWSATEIDFDVDLRQLQGQAGVDTLCAFLCAVGRRLGKPVLMSAEGGLPASGARFRPDRRSRGTASRSRVHLNFVTHESGSRTRISSPNRDPDVGIVDACIIRTGPEVGIHRSVTSQIIDGTTAGAAG
ncbi:hypothetical protein [Nocardia coubleae]|uniref:hypothetical protein n=1 Tax=Nocardia coubleae TaxID=356147 RepID=UPI000AD23356|nr:hypothetical protein [Nocardia coubleae]